MGIVILILSFLADEGYIESFRVTKDKIFITVRKKITAPTLAT